jgi:hypothetical protein
MKENQESSSAMEQSLASASTFELHDVEFVGTQKEELN